MQPLPLGPLSGFLGLRDLERRHGIPSLDAMLEEYVTAVKAPSPDEDRRRALVDVVDKALPHFDLFGAVSYFRLASIARHTCVELYTCFVFHPSFFLSLGKKK